MGKRRIFYVDVPDPSNWDSSDPSWVNITVLASREDAIAFCKEYFGADKDGNVCLITEGETDEEEEPWCDEAFWTEEATQTAP